MRNVADEQAQAQSNINGGIDVDLSDIVVNASGTIGISGGPGDLIRSGREAQAAEAEVDDQFDERVSSSPSIDDGGLHFVWRASRQLPLWRSRIAQQADRLANLGS